MAERTRTANGIDTDELREPKITVGQTDKATIVTFTNKRMLKEWDIQMLQDLIMVVIEQKRRIKLTLDFRNVQFISSSAGLGALIMPRFKTSNSAHLTELYRWRRLLCESKLP